MDVEVADDEAVVCAGSYEGGLHGWTVDRETLALSLKFSFGAKRGVLVSGGDDEMLRVYSLRTYRQVGEVGRQSGTITDVAWCGETHVLSASADGTICVWRTSDWECVHIFGGHKAAVMAVAAHPSGRLALSVGADRTLRLWDLINGRCAFISRTKGEASACSFSEDGAKYLIVLGSACEVRSVEANAVVARATHPTACIAARFLEGTHLFATADGSGALRVWSPEGEELWAAWRRGSSRIKALCSVIGETDGDDDDADLAGWTRRAALVAATSDGTLETWRPGPDVDDPVATVSCGMRLTSLSVHVAPPQAEAPAPAVAAAASKKKKKKRKQQEPEEPTARNKGTKTIRFADDVDEPTPKPPKKKQRPQPAPDATTTKQRPSPDLAAKLKKRARACHMPCTA